MLMKMWSRKLSFLFVPDEGTWMKPRDERPDLHDVGGAQHEDNRRSVVSQTPQYTARYDMRFQQQHCMCWLEVMPHRDWPPHFHLNMVNFPNLICSLLSWSQVGAKLASSGWCGPKRSFPA